MCDFAGKLTAWLDGELPAEEVADAEGHLEVCMECRGRVEAYRQVSGAFEAYCDAYGDAVMASKRRRKRSGRVLAASGVAAAIAALFLLSPRARVLQSSVPAPTPVAGLIVNSQPIQTVEERQVARPTPTLVRPVPRIGKSKRAQIGHFTPRAQVENRDVSNAPAEPAVEIAIPADAIFPPGALPEGVGFTADVTIAPDGSAQQIRLRPQLTEFERRSTQP